MDWEQPSEARAAERLSEIAREALKSPEGLNVDDPSNPTGKSIQGWAVELAGEHGSKLESAMGVWGAGAALLGLSKAPWFSEPEPRARAFLEGFL